MRKEIKRKNFEWNCWSIRFQKQIKRKKSPEKVITTDQLIAELKQKVQEDKEKEERKLERKRKAKNKKEKNQKQITKKKIIVDYSSQKKLYGMCTLSIF